MSVVVQRRRGIDRGGDRVRRRRRMLVPMHVHRAAAVAVRVVALPVCSITVGVAVRLGPS